jgi:hypothetical protein
LNDELELFTNENDASLHGVFSNTESVLACPVQSMPPPDPSCRVLAATSTNMEPHLSLVSSVGSKRISVSFVTQLCT